MGGTPGSRQCAIDKGRARARPYARLGRRRRASAGGTVNGGAWSPAARQPGSPAAGEWDSVGPSGRPLASGELRAGRGAWGSGPAAPRGPCGPGTPSLRRPASGGTTAASRGFPAAVEASAPLPAARRRRSLPSAPFPPPGARQAFGAGRPRRRVSWRATSGPGAPPRQRLRA